MGLFRRESLFHPIGNDTFKVNLAVETRQSLLSLAEDLGEIQTGDRPELRRLFPTAYANDPERDAGYQIFARDQLIEQRREAIEVIRSTVEAETMTGEELAAWMGILNDFRLVLGTLLDVSEDDIELDMDSPDAGTHLLYHELGQLVSAMVESLTTSLPEPEDDDDIDHIIDDDFDGDIDDDFGGDDSAAGGGN